MNRNDDGEHTTEQSGGQDPRDNSQQRIDGDEEEEDSVARIERRRHMNMIHSRRKRQRRKIEVEVLKEQVASLSLQNARLRSENQILEQAVVQAHNIAELVDKQSQLNEQQPHQGGDQKLPAISPGTEQTVFGSGNSPFALQAPPQQQLLMEPSTLTAPTSAAAAAATGAWNQGSVFLPPVGLTASMGFPFVAHPQDYRTMNHQQQQLSAQQQINLAQLLEQMQQQLRRDDQNAKK